MLRSHFRITITSPIRLYCSAQLLKQFPNISKPNPIRITTATHFENRYNGVQAKQIKPLVSFQIKLQIGVDNVLRDCIDLDSIFSVLDNDCSRTSVRSCSVTTAAGRMHQYFAFCIENVSVFVLQYVINVNYSAIHRAASLMATGRSMTLTGTIPVEQKNESWWPECSLKTDFSGSHRASLGW